MKLFFAVVVGFCSVTWAHGAVPESVQKKIEKHLLYQVRDALSNDLIKVHRLAVTESNTGEAAYTGEISYTKLERRDQPECVSYRAHFNEAAEEFMAISGDCGSSEQ